MKLKRLPSLEDIPLAKLSCLSEWLESTRKVPRTLCLILSFGFVFLEELFALQLRKLRNHVRAEVPLYLLLPVRKRQSSLGNKHLLSD